MWTLHKNQIATLAFLGLGGLTSMGALSMADAPSPRLAPNRLDVAMDGTSFFFEGPVTESGVPARGTPFVVEGYIYPGGTFAEFGPLRGVLPDGSPEFPELVLGKWTCRGWHLQDGDAPTGPVVVTHQTFDLGNGEAGENMITTDGIELADFDKPFRRVLTGGTGLFAGIRGQHQQVYVGGALNATDGFNASFLFDF